MGQTIRTCSLALAAGVAVLAVVPANASPRLQLQTSGATTFVGARAAELTGDARRAAVLYAALSEADPANALIANRAISQAIAAGDPRLALRLAAGRPARSLGIDARLMVVADRLVREDGEKALELLRTDADGGTLSFLAPFVQAWLMAERRDAGALQVLAQVPAGSVVAPYAEDHRGLIMLHLGRTAEAMPLLEKALARAGGRQTRLRIAIADGLMRAGDPAAALAMVAGKDPALAYARTLIERNRRPGGGIAGAAPAYAELLSGIAIDLNQSDSRALPVAMVQVARVADPLHPTLPLLLGLLLGESERQDDAISILRGVPDTSLFSDQVREAEIRVLTRSGRLNEALARAQAFVASPQASAGDWARLGDVLDEAGRYGPAADAFGRAVALAEAGRSGPEAWQLHLLRGAMLERADRWAEAKAALARARALAPDNPLVLNFLGYAQLERGENLDAAEELIAEASRRAPDDASITDSLGWAQFKRGKVAEAIETLQRAAASDAGQAEIHEHLGDALYTAGRKFEARHAWNAALITAEKDAKRRVEAKIRGGLQPANAAP